MNIKQFSIILFLIIFGLGLNLDAQNKKIQKADLVMNAGEYFTAREMYMKIYPKLKERDQKASVSYKIGYCSRQLRDYKNAAIWFKRAISSKYQDPLVYLYYADAMKMKGEYEEAKTYYSNYKDFVPDDSRGDDGIKSCEDAQNWIAHPTRYVVSEISMINSRDNDFAPAISNDSNILYFTSTRSSVKGNKSSKINDNSGQAFADIYLAKKDLKGVWSQPVPININSEFDDGSCTLEGNGMKMYYTYCPIIKDKESPCMIMTATKDNDQWSNLSKVQLFSDSTVSCGHPSLSADELTLYFVSDNPKGQGGKDIWFVTRNSKTSNWGTPQNIGSDINTKYDELFPSCDDEGNLFFSTEGRPGMGGFDLFKATHKDDGTWKVENLKYPMNSSLDDFSICFNRLDNTRGYFASNRASGKGDDLYAFYLKPIEIYIVGYVINEVNRAFISDVEIQISGSDGSNLKVTTGFDGKFTATVRANVDYNLVTNKKGFLKAATNISTKGITEDGKKFETTLYLKPSIGVIQIPNINYDFNDSTLREESKVALDELVDLLKVNPTVTIELRANTDFRGDEKANLKLSQGRANSVVNYLVSQGINRKRLVPVGLGESTAFVVDKLTADKYPFLKEGDVLNEKFINALLTNEQKEICHELNRRTEFRVLSDDYKNFETFGNQ